MESLIKREIRKIPFLNKIKSLAKTKDLEVYLVGGTLRDIFIFGQIQKPDFDFAVSKGTLKFSRDFSSLVGGRLVVLDKILRNVRVVVKRKNKFLNYDFSKFRGKDIFEDLKKRDFTINSLALKIDLLPRIEIIDCLGAQKDFKRRVIRCSSSLSFPEDPLRILRAFSLAALFKFKIDKNTQELIKKNRKLLNSVAGERISEELFKIFSADNSYLIIKSMDSLKVLEEILPQIKPMKGLNQGPYHHLDVWLHSLETLRCFESLVERKLKKDEDISAYLNQEVAQRRKILHLIKFSCLLHDIGKPLAKIRRKKKTLFYGHEKIGQELAETISKRLKLSFKEEEFLKKLIYFHLRPGYLADVKKPTLKAVYRYFRDTQEYAVAILLLSLSDWRATRGPLTSSQRRRSHERVIFSLIRDYFKKLKEKPLKKLVNGYDLMKRLKISPSPLIGELLRKISEKQSLGQIKTKKEALDWAIKYVRKKKV
ncbi:MAG: hypothetical protein DRP80_00560 [Candidatus Omnitrophota bacterium]|nr:MAG: hypothetical protein DRP80_00560 [Candidatus Omnitrophota bacterium]